MTDTTCRAVCGRAIAACTLAVLASACGGGASPGNCTIIDPNRSADLPSCSGAQTQTSSPDGLYLGTTSTGRTTAGLLLDDGSFYVLYSATNNPAIIAGAVQGTGSPSNGSFSSTNAKDINLEGLGLLSTTLAASYTPKQSLSGTVTYPSLGQTVTFSGTYDPRYDVAPSLAIIAGNYSGQAGSTAGAENATLSVTSTGVISGIGTSGCTFSGVATPRSKGNVYNTSVTFGGAPCLLPNGMLTGVAYFDSSTMRLYVIAMTSGRDAGVIYAGTKL